MSRSFRRDYGVYICEHIFRNTRPVLVCVRDDDGSYQFLCGEDDPEEDVPHVVGVGHLLDRDPSLEVLANLEEGTLAVRTSAEGSWEYEPLHD